MNLFHFKILATTIWDDVMGNNRAVMWVSWMPH